MKSATTCLGTAGANLLGLVVALAIGCSTGKAQWIQQTLNLKQGWNSVFLEVQPEPANCDIVFSNTPVASVWTWNRHFSTVQYIADPNSLLPGQPDWLAYVPASDQSRAAANLFNLQGGKPYLIKANANVTLSLVGRPVVRGIDWISGSFNLVGFGVSSNNSPTFQSFFAPSAAQSGQPAFRLSSDGTWSQVTSPGTTTLSPGEAYWVRASGESRYSGFFNVLFEQGRGLDFGRTLTELDLRVVNVSSNVAVYNLKSLASLTPPGTNIAALAGNVPLSYWRMNIASNLVGWVPLSDSLTSPSIPPGGTWSLRLEVRRSDMATFALPAGYSSALYQSLLELTDGRGCRAVVPVTANGLQTPAAQTSVGKSIKRGQGSSGASGTAVDPRAGLWVGSATITKVSQAAISPVPLPTASDFQFKLILHVDNSGDVRLLQKVVIAWTNGVAATNAAGFTQSLSPGRYALITDDSLLGRFSGSALSDGVLTARRISSVAFGFRDPILFARTGSFGQTNGSFNCTVTLGSDDNVNPFVHRYHPDHNNLNERYDGPQVESFNVTRQISLSFTASDLDAVDNSLPGWGDDQLGGTYSEMITGLHKDPMYIEGTFRVSRASSVPTLNDLPF